MESLPHTGTFLNLFFIFLSPRGIERNHYLVLVLFDMTQKKPYKELKERLEHDSKEK